ncbi:peptidoglycan-binding domain-containing protein [Myceligenerans pegani]|uniref:Peptidoglycan-binding protein n=1 Tax=Myceligenerans pegani TaxID=2776917 RepID=A0ABR9N220_9MICO|nr:peptidoglycan-binding domain-containing protein [Myceligenerans sp. TRM 65318]MBE1877707.1 peptidoglycan-binding protein [Myceligenerans sp. TRM 65318]MBE3019978.1 peptidoglycan-binding protein [Myceligenerans sp. TRM 65318]
MVTRLAAVAVGALVATLGMAGTASATEADEGAYSTSFWDGGSGLTDDFGDHYDEIGNSLCNGCADSWDTGSVRAWQAILYAEGYITQADIDGKFGPGTASATWEYQDDNGLGRDGKVGPQTWGFADDRLRWNSSRTTVIYSSASRAGAVYFERGNSDHGNPGGGGAYRLKSTCITFTSTPHCKSFGSPRIYH